MVHVCTGNALLNKKKHKVRIKNRKKKVIFELISDFMSCTATHGCASISPLPSLRGFSVENNINVDVEVFPPDRVADGHLSLQEMNLLTPSIDEDAAKCLEKSRDKLANSYVGPELLD